MIRENQLQNCPITVDDANHALKIYGPDIAALRGKTTRTTPVHVPSDQIRPFRLKFWMHTRTLHCDLIFSLLMDLHLSVRSLEVSISL